jgi:N-methylhydantoinase B
MSRRVDYEIPAGDRVQILTGGGGGYGDPLTRPVASVLDDVENGYVSREAAERDYGVSIRPDGTVDESQTRRLRGDAPVTA